ncbi:MAG: antibiotic biosynthesis monooxygenase family protein [Actinomycetota bacterium]
MIIRIFDTAMDPGDIEEGKKLFREQVRPAFLAFEGCSAIEMVIGVEEHSQDLVDIASISHWDSMEAVQAAISTDEYQAALAEIKKLFSQSPLIRHFEVVE